MDEQRRRLAVVTTHPIQYYAPWFRWIAAQSEIQLKVFYLWNRGAEAKHDPGFGHAVQWDVPLLEGYEYEFLRNTSVDAGSHRFFGMRNPDLRMRVADFAPAAVLLIGYRYASLLRLIFTPEAKRGYPLLFRGDSHRLGASRSGKWKGEIRRRLISKIYRQFAAFLYVGRANREYFLRHGVAEKRLFFSPHAVDNERFMSARAPASAAAEEWKRELGIPPENLVVLFAGKFEEKKRPLDLLEAFDRLGRSDVSLLFVGAGKLEEELRGRASKVANVVLAPFQNQTEMPRTYAACDLFVLPSFGPGESWGLAINEALCLAKPVIVSTHVGCGPDLVRQGQNGMVFPAGDVSALTEALRAALSDPVRLQRWGMMEREMVSRYSYGEATRGLLDALDAVGAPTP